jgi:two-component system, chemotaxis family, protein-glutamate methylesterase/glutaminase
VTTADTRVLFCGRAAWLVQQARAVSAAANLIEAGPPVDFGQLIDSVLRFQPQVVLMDLEEFTSDTLAAIEAVMAERPTPILLLLPTSVDRQEAMKALAAGALDVLERPGKLNADFARALEARVRLLSRVAVVAHPRGKRRKRHEKPKVDAGFPVVAIAASLGGPKALSALLKALPKDFAPPIALCQHITPGFADDLARWLAASTRRDVRQATDGARLEPGVGYVAPSAAHLRIRPDGTIELDPGPEVGGFKPSCDVLLSTAAQSFGTRCIGVVLTGMGRDGALGLLEVRKRGGRTIAQDEKTSVVFGMPGEAIALGAAEAVLPLEEIAPRLAKWSKE